MFVFMCKSIPLIFSPSFLQFSVLSGPLKISAFFPFFVYLRYLPNNHKQLTFTSIVNIGAQPRPHVGGQVTQDPVPGQLCAGGGHGGGPRTRIRHLARQEEPRAPPTMSQALARSSPCSRPYSQSVCQGARLTAHPVSSPLLSVLTNHVAAMDLVGPVLTEPVSQQSVAVAARYLFRQAGAGAASVHSAVCHHDPDLLHPGQLTAGGVAPRPHPVSTALHCAVTTPHKRHVPAGPAAGAHRPSPQARRYFPLCSAQTNGHKDQLGSRPVSDLLVSSNQWHCLPCVRPWLAGWRLSASPSWSPPSPQPSSRRRTRPWRTSTSRPRP